MNDPRAQNPDAQSTDFDPVPLGHQSEDRPGDLAPPGDQRAGSVTCIECGGSGRLEGHEVCPVCGGTGRVASAPSP